MIITISRQTATNGELIGHLVAERLGLRFVDRELLDMVAHQLHVDPTIVTHFDESALNPVQSLLWEWRSSVSLESYARYLRQALQRIAANGGAVIIGRGANFVLHCPGCLHVRIVAPMTLRSAIYRATHDVKDWEAQRIIRQGDRARERFIHTLYHAEISDPEQYDLTLNLLGLTPEMVADIIVYAARVRTAHQLIVEPHVTLPQHIDIMTRHRRPVRPEVVERPKRTA